MRGDLPANVLAFTVTVPMFAQLCALGDDSFLGKGFLTRLRKARGGSLRVAHAGGRAAAADGSDTIRP